MRMPFCSIWSWIAAAWARLSSMGVACAVPAGTTPATVAATPRQMTKAMLLRLPWLVLSGVERRPERCGLPMMERRRGRRR